MKFSEESPLKVFHPAVDRFPCWDTYFTTHIPGNVAQIKWDAVEDETVQFFFEHLLQLEET